MRFRIVKLDGPAQVECAASYLADNLHVPAYAFVFRVLDSNTRFTVYASTPDRYVINGSYRLSISEPTDVPLHLPADEAEFLRVCLLGVEDRWRNAMMEADAGAKRPTSERPPEPGHLNIEPDPSGYRKISNVFGEELARVQRLRQHVDQFLAGLLDAGGDPS
jgi:hypothetical protein